MIGLAPIFLLVKVFSYGTGNEGVSRTHYVADARHKGLVLVHVIQETKVVALLADINRMEGNAFVSKEIVLKLIYLWNKGGTIITRLDYKHRQYKDWKVWTDTGHGMVTRLVDIDVYRHPVIIPKEFGSTLATRLDRWMMKRLQPAIPDVIANRLDPGIL